MHQWFTTRDHHDSCRCFQNFRPQTSDFIHRMFIRIPAFFHITPGATYITTPKPDEISRLPLVKSFTLDGVEVFHYWKNSFRFMVPSFLFFLHFLISHFLFLISNFSSDLPSIFLHTRFKSILQ